jgi:antitoxin MazE
LLLFFWSNTMLTAVRKVGNSRGVLIPAAFLASCQIEDQVDMQLQDGQIVIRPVKRTLREGWFAQPETTAAAQPDEAAELQAWDTASTGDDSEWVW